ncbi:MAG: efflux transporter outer membrane subunit [Gammaproteobacteria bacterium]|nr:MAG: efflux transporter outer membrane subunit [Gammaproteobacteria bacterium]
MKFKKYLSISVISLAASTLVACSSMDEIPKTNIEYAPVWEYAPRTEAAIAIENDWWKAFESTQLTQLVELAQKKNPDIIIASEHVRQAELQMKIANASLFPSLGLSASSGERRAKVDGGDWSNSGSTSAGLSANYEIDLWGGEMANRHAAGSSFRATQYANEASRLSIAAGVATAWFNYLALQERLETAKKNVEIAERIQRIVDSLYRNGAANAADVAAQRTNLLSQQNALLPLQLQLDQTRAAIALLEGQIPQAYQLANEKILDIKIPDIKAGVPADVITRRPDVASSEAQLQASSANVYAARIALLPSFSLSGNMGKSASELFALNPATQSAGWSLGIAQTIFAGGRYVNQIKISESRRVELVEQYRKVILTALQEVDDALNRVNITRQQEVNQQNIVEQSARSLRLNETRYREGEIDLQSLLDSQRSLFQSQDSLVQQRLARLKASVDLYKALGGGWQNPQ